MIQGFLYKSKAAHRRRIEQERMHKRTRIFTKRPGRQYSARQVIADSLFCDDGSYIPNQYIRGTIHLPGTSPEKGYVSQ